RLSRHRRSRVADTGRRASYNRREFANTLSEALVGKRRLPTNDSRLPASMACPNCHADVPAHAALCPKCGQRLASAATAAAPPAPPAPGGTAIAPSGAASVQPPSAAERLRPGQHAIPHEEEKELWRGGYSSKAMLGGWIFAGLVTVAAAVVPVILPTPFT